MGRMFPLPGASLEALEGHSVAAAVSGGADSVALALWLRRHQDVGARSFTFAGIIHVNHGLRGAESARDEAFCRTLYPTQFGEQEMMGGIVAKIRNEGAGHPLHLIVDDIDELNMYCRRYHHGENQNAATEQIDDAELLGYVKRALKIVGCPP